MMNLDDPNNDISKIAVPEHRPLPHAERARQIEAQAGAALKRDYWVKPVITPFGEFSRRALGYTTLGLVLTFLFLAAVFAWQVSRVPQPDPLAETNAFTVMTHVFANFASSTKDDQFQPYRGPEGQNWRNRDAYSFAWVDANGKRQIAVVVSYASTDDLLLDYIDRTRISRITDRTGAVGYANNINIEGRTLDNYGAEWIVIRMSNLLLLVTPTATHQDIQALQSHFINIVGADYRDYIPTATP